MILRDTDWTFPHDDPLEPNGVINVWSKSLRRSC